jgi:esterase/lipase superfamily enzyme
MAFMHHEDDRATVQRESRIGRVILVGSDLDREQLAAYLVEGLMKVPERLSIYVSSTDKALGFSKWLFNRKRLGQMWEEAMNPKSIAFLKSTPELQFINVSAAEGSDYRNGHAYFRTSPWVSSDILISLKYNLEPDQRGLVRAAGNPVWFFPENYIDRLKGALEKKPSS